MIAQVIQKLTSSDEHQSFYFIDTDRLDEGNLIDKVVARACGEKSFNQFVEFNIDEEMSKADDEGRVEDFEFWEECRYFKKARIPKKKSDGLKPEKIVHLTLIAQ